MSYKIISKPKNKDFKHGDEIKIEFQDEDGNVETRTYEYMDTAKIYDIIESEKFLNLNDKYVKNFSLSDYRELKETAPLKKIVLKNFTAVNSFFESENIVDFSGAEFTGGNMNFSGTNFAGDLVDFSNCIFGSGKIIFCNLTFNECDVHFSDTNFGDGDVDFAGTDFGSGLIDFKSTKFGSGKIIFRDTRVNDGKLNFNSAKFSDGDVDFNNSEFGKVEINFSNAEFGKGWINFINTEFDFGKFEFIGTKFSDGIFSFFQSKFDDGSIYISNAEFGSGDISFSRSEFKNGNIVFSNTKLGDGEIYFSKSLMENGNVNFLECKFGSGEIFFTDADFPNVYFEKCHFDFHIDFRFKRCKYLSLKDTIVRDIIEIDNIERLNIADMKNLGKIYLDWYKNDIQKLIIEQPDTTYAEKSDQFHILKENYRSLGWYDEEDEAYVWFRRYDLKAEKQKTKEKSSLFIRFIKYIRFILEKLAFDWIGGYGTKPSRVIMVMLVVWFVFAILFSIPGIDVSDGNGNIKKLFNNKIVNKFANSGYYSAITFLTIGYGDISPQNTSAAFFSAFEGFIGLFLMAYFTVAFVRKVLR